ncbi:tetratricopeptide repeat protein, partial [Leptolyngbya sp. FACHB-36]|uniref:tetratricopeptide repeat protein n=1 Tax=Leptolyngbya sp. FACHB-36 TaxID=2692808 RepID=UPI00168133FE
SFLPMRPFAQPLWDGSPLNGKTIFLHAEQGVGDMIQFIRYVPLVIDRGGRVIVECHPPLVRLFQGLPGIHQVIAYGATPLAFDVHAPLMSLPNLLGTTIDTIPASLSFPSDIRNSEFKIQNSKFKLGFVWTGNPQNPYNRTRTCPLELLLTLALPNVALYSLQKDLSPEDQERLRSHPHVHDLSDRLTDFSSTAALIQSLDLVISIDTAVAHLAGALGKPVWLLLPFAPDWRWMLHRDDSPWYPTMRLFRQPSVGDWSTVIQQVRSTLEHTTSNAASLSTALHHYHTRNFSDAEHECHEILQQKPNHAEVRHLLAVILCQTGRTELAIPHLRQVVQTQPQWAEARGNLANALQQRGESVDAIAHYERAIALKPDYVEAYQNLSVALRDQDRLEEAVERSQQAIALQPDFAEAHYNLGFIQRQLGRLDAAIASYRRALQLQPNFVSAHKNLGHALLLTGDLTQGFAEYEWRWQQPNWSRSFSQPLWDGSPLPDKTILLHAEQGCGDTLQFIRYVALVRDRVGSVIVECQESLLRLLQTVPGIDRLVPQGAPLLPFDVHAPLLSLPRILGTTLDTIPAPFPFIPKIQNSEFKIQNSKFNVGIVWSGNPDHKNNRQRSCPLDQFQRLLDIPNVCFYSLQKGAAAAELASDSAIADLSQDLHDFADTAATIAQLDLVITVDTAVAHLAGAMGKPVWLLLCFAPDWRWMLERQDSPWYPTMRLFRQPRRGDWSAVFDRVHVALRQLAQPTPEPTRSTTPTIALSWQLDQLTEWGIYGTNLALQLRTQSRVQPVLTSMAASLTPLDRALLGPLQLDAPPQSSIVLHALTDDVAVEPLPDQRNVGLVRLSHSQLSAAAIARLQTFDQLITFSSWNAEILSRYGLQAEMILPGIDPSVFHPAPNANRFGDRFVVFCRGELSDRSGFDVILSAFKTFHAHHPDALLLVEAIAPFQLNADLPPTAVVVMEQVPNPLLGQLLREVSVVVFADRCYSTPLLAMQSLACGIPTVLSANTAHLDLIRHNLGYPLRAQPSVKPSIDAKGWGEPDADELVETLERIYVDRQEAHHRSIAAADFMQNWTWNTHLQHLLRLA